MKTKTVLILLVFIALFAKNSQSQETATETILNIEFEKGEEAYNKWPTNEMLEQYNARTIRVLGRLILENYAQAKRTFINTVVPKHKINPEDTYVIEANIQFDRGSIDEPFGIFFVDSDGVLFWASETAQSYSYVGSSANDPGKIYANNLIKHSAFNYFCVRVYSTGFFFMLNGQECRLFDANIKFPITDVGYFIKGSLVVSSDIFRVSREYKLPPVPIAHFGRIDYLKLKSESNQLVSGYSHNCFVWDTESGQKVDSLTIKYIDAVYTSDQSFRVKRDAGYKKEKDNVLITDPETYAEIAKISFKGRCSEPVIFENTIVVLDKKNNAVNLYDIPKGSLLKSVKLVDIYGEDSYIEEMNDLKHLYLEGNGKYKYIDLENGTTIYEIEYPLNYSATDFTFSDDRKFLFSCNNNELKVYDGSNGNLLKSKVFEEINYLGGTSISHDNQYAIFYSGYRIRIVELESMTIIKDYTMRKEISRLVTDKDFQYAYVALVNGELHKMDIASGETVMMFGKLP